MDVYTKSCCICRELVVKTRYLDTNKHEELRSEVGNQADQAKTEKQELKSQIYIKRGHAGWARMCVGLHKCAEAEKTSSPWCRMGQDVCRTTRAWCRTVQPSSSLQRKSAQWCRTARATWLEGNFPYLSLY